MTVMVICPSCSEAAPVGATVCAECGEKLTPQPFQMPHRGPVGCTCGGNDLCATCELRKYEGLSNG